MKKKVNKKFWKDKRVFVTGANGFLGSWLTKALVTSGARVVVLIRDWIPCSVLTNMKNVYNSLEAVVKGDIIDCQLIARIFNEHNIDSCFHIGAQTIVGIANKSPISTFESNIRGTWNILEAARNIGVQRMVVASSDKAYGEQQDLPYKESYSLNALHPYDASKACTDILARTYACTYDMPIVVTRCANIYGGGDLNFSRIIPDTIRSIIQNKNPVIRSDGTPLRDYIYIDDAVNAYLIAAENADKKGIKGEAFNFGSNSPVKVLDLVKEIISVSGNKSLKPVIKGKGKSKGEINNQYLSSVKAERLLGWKTVYSLEKGLRETIKWYED
ncbi:GDP-mannose 4,6-dehydratase [bacterium]|nr:GDP-mannose 4,6-dehydratase [bacterium]